MNFESWFARLKELAAGEQVEWIVADASAAQVHLAAYEKGLSPEEELQQLLDMAEWRGCGCGGGS